MFEGRLFDYMDERLEAAKHRGNLSDKEFDKLDSLVEKQVKEDIEAGIAADSKEMEENIDSIIEYYIDEIRNGNNE